MPITPFPEERRKLQAFGILLKMKKVFIFAKLEELVQITFIGVAKGFVHVLAK